jgi:hypothetical protein
MDLDPIAKTYQARQTVFEMLSDRGYLILKAELEMPLDAFRA